MDVGARNDERKNPGARKYERKFKEREKSRSTKKERGKLVFVCSSLLENRLADQVEELPATPSSTHDLSLFIPSG